MIPKLKAFLSAREQELSVKEQRRIQASDPEPQGEEKQIFETFYQCYECELDISYDGGDLVSSCFIRRGDYCSSLAKAECEGTLDHDRTGEEIDIPDRVVATVRRWAEDNGY